MSTLISLLRKKAFENKFGMMIIPIRNRKLIQITKTTKEGGG